MDDRCTCAKRCRRDIEYFLRINSAHADLRMPFARFRRALCIFLRCCRQKPAADSDFHTRRCHQNYHALCASLELRYDLKPLAASVARPVAGNGEVLYHNTTAHQQPHYRAAASPGHSTHWYKQQRDCVIITFIIRSWASISAQRVILPRPHAYSR